ncbi:MAG: SDR family oxidoreductase [Actinomycetota bacterium]
MPSEEMSALVTGGAKGLGRAICERLAADGWAIAVNDLDEAAAAETCAAIEADGGRAVAVIGDATDEVAVAHVVAQAEAIAPIGAAVLNATGPQPDGSIEATGWREVTEELDFFVKSPLLVARALLDRFRSRGGGRIVHIDSEVVSKTPSHRTAYVTAKSAQAGLMRAWALEAAQHGITVNSVAPGFVPVERHALVPVEAIEEYRRTVPSGRMGVPADVAAAVAFFCSDEASFVTGQRLLVDGGRHLT